MIRTVLLSFACFLGASRSLPAAEADPAKTSRVTTIGICGCHNGMPPVAIPFFKACGYNTYQRWDPAWRKQPEHPAEYCAEAAAQAPAQAVDEPSASAVEITCARDRGYAPAGFAPAAMSACYAEPARKTFFVYLAADAADPIRAAYYDHAAGTVPRPAILPLGPGAAAIDGLWLTLDHQGYLWIYAGAAEGWAGTIFKSTKPYDIGAFSRCAGPALSKPQLWHVAGAGCIVVGLRTDAKGTAPYFANSPDGRVWSEPVQLAAIDAGHTFVTARQLNKVGMALACYSAGQDPTAATNLYYLETPDAGKTWQDVKRANLKLPVTGEEPGLRAWEYRSIQWTVLLKDMGFTAGRPVILYLNGRPATPGQPPPAAWTTARFVPRGWESTGLLLASTLADPGQLYFEPANAWRLFTARNAPVAPARRGPKAPAHEDFVAWYTEDQGRSWYRRAAISGNPSDRNVLVRPVDAQPECYALWITGEVGEGSGQSGDRERAGTATSTSPASSPATNTRPAGARPAPTTTRAAPAARPTGPPRLLLLNRDADAFLLPTVMADPDEKLGRGPTTTRPATRPG